MADERLKAGLRLARMVQAKKRAIEAVRRKRSWRPSEKALTIADLEQDIEALMVAIRDLNLEADKAA